MRLSFYLLVTIWFLPSLLIGQLQRSDNFFLNSRGYYEAPGISVMVFDDFYPEGHQGGLTLIQCGKRLAANGDVRLEDAPGQWSPVPKVGWKNVDTTRGTITVCLWYPDSSKDRKGFNPIEYPDVKFRYRIITVPEERSLRVRVVLDDPLPPQWRENVGFNLEIFPGEYFGEGFLMDTLAGLFPRQFNGPVRHTSTRNSHVIPLAEGKRLIVAPGKSEKQFTVTSLHQTLTLLDGRAFHNNGWFVVRSTFGKDSVIEWILTPSVHEGWESTPVIQVSQVGFHPFQPKYAVIELDSKTRELKPIELLRLEVTPKTGETSEVIVKRVSTPTRWGSFLRYQYIRFDFSEVTREGLYRIRYGTTLSHSFPIRRDLYEYVWHSTVNTFLPVQMCHMRVEDRYKVWHGLCHMDDARMAPTDHIHFDGYKQGKSTLTKYTSGEHVPGLNTGGWHDAGDYDLRIESQAETVYKLALGYELFPNDYDETTIDQLHHRVILHHPDGKPDMLQQIEHGVLSIINAYESMGRLYRGIIEPTLKQYVHLGDAATMTDNLVYSHGVRDPVLQQSLPEDDRWVFTEENPLHEHLVVQSLAAAARVLRTYDSTLARKCLRIVEELFEKSDTTSSVSKFCVAAELLITTGKPLYRQYVVKNSHVLEEHLFLCSEVAGRVVQYLGDQSLRLRLERVAQHTKNYLDEMRKKNPYNVPYAPRIWGAGWEIQSLAVKEYFLALAFPHVFDRSSIFSSLQFLFGCHPGENTASFVSGVGAHSVTVAYGTNRDEWSYIPGGIVSGTALIRPDFPELKVWPYLWQQTEYVLGGGTADFLFLTWAAHAVVKGK